VRVWCEATQEAVSDRRAAWFCPGTAPGAREPHPGFEAEQARQAEAERKTANGWSGY
jgi:hypothetical protein